MKTRETVDVDAVLAGLKDFQRETVEYAFDRLYGDEATKRLLVADEVGLGKTLVARGLIAKAIEHLRNDVERIDVVYVCSNAEIARQNIKRLDVTARGEFALAARITLLPLVLHELTKNSLNFVSFTPGTSLDLKSAEGTATERALLHRLLREAWGGKALDTAGGRRVFQGGVRTSESFAWTLKEVAQQRLDKGLVHRFIDDIATHEREAAKAGVPSLRDTFDELRDRFARRRQHWPQADRDRRRAFIGELRDRLARVCIHALEPDLIILDEFQRFKDLLRADEPVGELAQQLFTYPKARVLLLSATPYKMYTVAEDLEDDHYADLIDTLRFLFSDDKATAAFERDMRAYREALFRLNPSELGDAVRLRRRLEKRLRKVIVRTERLSSTPDRDGMLVSRPLDVRLTPDDLLSYVAQDNFAARLDAGDMIEYWKSAPYLLNFMERGYKLGAKIDQSNPWTLKDVDRRAILDWADVEAYRPIDPRNARLRALAADVLDTGMWKLLWLPPSLPYYELGAPFDASGLRGATKRLVFSAWAVAPKAIASLLSYEAERRMLGHRAGKVAYSELRVKQKPLLRLSMTKGRLPGMPVVGILYPSFSLARLGDVAALAGEAGRVLRQDEVIRLVEDRVSAALEPLLADKPTEGPVDERWYWAAGILLDRLEDGAVAADWLAAPALANAFTGGTERGDDFAKHLEQARDVAAGELGRPPDDLVEVIGRIAMAAPGVVALRTLARLAGGVETHRSPDVRKAAARVAWGFRTLFNLPEATALIRRHRAYWKEVVEYCFSGCLQAVLDEYAHVLVEWLGLQAKPVQQAVDAVAETMHTVVALRTASYEIRDISATDEDGAFQKHALRARFALRFGDNRADDGGEAHRPTLVREAFNSPFWPFVLASTSVGQEGLDFHLYCHAVVHWNLPANPVDLEQREGRVHRYKGHAIRKNLASAHSSAAFAPRVVDPWAELFAHATAHRPKSKNDLVPNWIFDNGPARIERLAPLLPLSRDAARLEALSRSLAAYRLAFGQPRQEDLIAFLGASIGDTEVARVSEALRIDLSPR